MLLGKKSQNYWWPLLGEKTSVLCEHGLSLKNILKILMVRVQVASFNYSVLLLGACVKILVFIELLMPIVIAVDRRHEWPVPTFPHWMWPGLFSPFSVCWLWRASRSCAWSLPWAALTLLAGPRELAAGSIWATDFPTVQWLQLWLPWSQSRVTSINIEIHQPSPTRDFRTWRWFFFESGPVHRRVVFFQWGKSL